MSLASYIGCNVQLQVNGSESEELIYIGACFAGDEELGSVRKYQFSTPFVYEVSSHWGIEITEYINEDTLNESKQKLLELCKIMDKYLQKGDYFELYSCWIGEESDQRVGKVTLPIYGFNIDQLVLPEKTLVRFEK
ncbi:hypothetical protein [Fictibacillus phosphorivorans]|uniref:hypothetical protein n=1 Tax=Fictibacillus phosphorivorans TaxID=1221500 RepID=UPI0035EA6290